MMFRLQIGGKIAAMMIAVSAVGLGVALYARQSLGSVAGHYSAMTNIEAPARIQLSRASQTVEQMGLAAALLIGSKEGSEKSTKALASIDEMFKRSQAFLKEAKAALPDQAQDISTLDSDVEALKENLQPVLDLHEDGDTAGALDALAQASATITRFTADIQRVNEDGVASLRQHADILAGEAARAGLMMTVISLMGAALGVSVALLASRRAITRPITVLRGQMQALASGDTSVVIAGQGRRDEIGGMSQAVQTFKDAALAKARLEAEAAALARAAEAERVRNEADRAAAAEGQARVVAALARGLAQLSHGDLVYRIAEPFGADYEALRVDFNAAMDQLQEALGLVAGAASALKAGTGEISAAADDLSRRTEQQAASLEETAAALDEISTTVRRTSEGAGHARDTVGAAKADAERSGHVVGQAVAAMTGIAASSSQIGQIIGVIDEIAFQTNLLALNAGVEAARAGEAGRGFAVVASEVRALAQRSAEAAKEIKALILSSRGQVEQGVALVGQTGAALTRIIAQIADLNTVVATIAASAQEQATGLGEINTAINQMDQATQQNAAMVEETTAASHALAGKTAELTALVGRFTVADATARPAPERRPARTASSAAPPRQPPGRTAAQPKPALAAHADDWQEF